MIIKDVFNKVTAMGRYDLPKAGEHQKSLMSEGVLAKDIPKRMYELTKADKAGCCLNYALSMIHLLHENGVDAYLVATPEENPVTGERKHIHASVFYAYKGKKFFDDPVGKVMGKEGDFHKIPFENFKQKMLKDGEKIKIFDLYGENGEKPFFGTFMSAPMIEFSK